MSVEDKATFAYRCGVRLVSYPKNVGLSDDRVVVPCADAVLGSSSVLLRWPCLSPFEAKAYDEVCPESWVLGNGDQLQSQNAPMCRIEEKRVCRLWTGVQCSALVQRTVPKKGRDCILNGCAVGCIVLMWSARRLLQAGVVVQVVVCEGC